MSEWDRLCKEMRRALKAFNVPLSAFCFNRVQAEGDRIQATTYIQDEELLQQLLKLEEATQKLDEIREYVSRAIEVNTSLSDDLKEKGYIIASDELCHRILEVLGPSIDSDKLRSISSEETKNE